MNEQSGRSEPAGRPEPGQPRGADRPGSGRSQQPGRRQPGSDVLNDLQRWLIRSSARNMRSQFEDQVRRTFSGQRPDSSDVWDVATTEIPPEVGESPECQWCPICRAARRMRDSGPGLAGQISGAGDAVAAAVQDAVRAFDTLLGKATGGSAPDGEPDSSSGQPGDQADGGAAEHRADPAQPAARPQDSGADAASRPDTLAGEHGPVGWKPGDRLATTGAAVADPWATATEPGMPSEPPTSDDETSDDPANGGPDGRGHGPSDRG